ncbi:TonB family protein [candidate division WOR-3 bacterium]|uniref:TonB family protein n=1 Tax=candidate division WOR-3 bacterium TaxID=2052148 RepID=A0A9D5K9N5_UNCW3|nr:TonB family protein [candidate division WOR-3 bacterium]MBD3364817.1 TonB family protein [candidate division WOR-3 bacterium]
MEVRMKREKKTLRDNAIHRMQLGIIGALAIVIAAFLSLGNVKIRPVKMSSTLELVPDRLEPLDDPLIPKPPPPKDNYGEIKEVTDPEKADTLGFNPPDWDSPLPGGDKNLDIDSIPFPGIDVTFPVLKTKIDIGYPRRLKEMRIEGTVQLLLGLDAEGRVFEARVFRSSGYDEFDKKAIDALRKARFSPANQNGIPVPVKVSFPVHFRLDK